MIAWGWFIYLCIIIPQIVREIRGDRAGLSPRWRVGLWRQQAALRRWTPRPPTHSFRGPRTA